MQRTAHLIAAALAVVALTSSCGSSSDPASTPSTTATPTGGGSQPVPTFEVTVAGEDITAPDELPTGPVTFEISSPDQVDEQQIQLLRLVDSTTPEAVQEALASGDVEAALEVARPAGGIGLEAGTTTELTVELHEARYLFLDPDTGAASPLAVAEGEAAAEPPAVDGTVTLRDFEIGLPEGFGTGTYAIESTDEQIHGLTLVLLDEGVTLEEVEALLAEDADLPGTEVVRAGNLGGDNTQVLTLDLAPGHYVAASYFPDFASGSIQAALGMVAEFDVEA